MDNFNSLTSSPATADSPTAVTTGENTAATALVPVFTGIIQGQAAQLCDARTLHAFMGVLRDFSNWIKGRIRKFGFVVGVDFITISRSPELASGNRGAAVDYHLSLDMAKELSMVENNAKGREARRYFMECEKQVLAALTVHPTDHIAVATPYAVLPNQTLSAEQADTLRNMLIDACADLAKDMQGMFMREAWSKLKSHFKVGYREIPQSQFYEAVSLVTRHIVYFNGTKVKALPAPDTPSIKNRRWLVSFSPIDGREVVQSVPMDAMVLTVPELCTGVLAGDIFGRDFINLAYAVNQRQYCIAVENKEKGIGEEIASKVRDLSDADLNIVNQRASMEVWLRSEVPQTQMA